MRGLLITVGVVSLLMTACVVLVVVLTAINWHSSDTLNGQRLHALQSDGLLRCQVAQISPWHARDVNRAGTTHGIGFGGTAPTVVARNFYLNDADPTSAMTTFLSCAQNSGWKVEQLPRAAGQVFSLTGTKIFPGGWMASLGIGVLMHAPCASQPIIEVYLQTDGV
jgi:hypothetical protein